MAEDSFDAAAARSRRDVLKKLGVGAAVAWTAPMVVSQPAGAASGTPLCAKCKDVFGPDLDKFACGESCFCAESTTGHECVTFSGGVFPTNDPSECTDSGLVAIDISCVSEPGSYFCLSRC